MDKEKQTVYELIELIWGAGFLMAFADLVREYENEHSR